MDTTGNKHTKQSNQPHKEKECMFSLIFGSSIFYRETKSINLYMT